MPGRSQLSPESEQWRHYGADAGGSRYSGAAMITTANVGTLERSWAYSTGDLRSKPQAIRRSAGESTPIIVEDSLVFCTPFNEVIALDPGTGAEKWRYDPKIDLEQRPANQFVCRGVAHWRQEGAAGACTSRILGGTNDGRVFAIDAKTGAPCADFGTDGEVRIDPGMELLWPGEFQITSAPTVAGDIVVVGRRFRITRASSRPGGPFEPSMREPASRAGVRPRSSKHDAANAADWRGGFPPQEGHANAWAPMSFDEGRGLLFISTSSPSPDFFGGLRPGNNRYADSVVALQAKTGEVVWSFQTVHHDIWDYDVPAQPALLTITKDGAARDVVVIAAKTGLLFVLDRNTGEPVLPVEERAVPQEGAAPGETSRRRSPFQRRLRRSCRIPSMRKTHSA